jgi:hypothetical protein
MNRSVRHRLILSAAAGVLAGLFAGSAQAQIHSDDFDSYKAGSNISGQGGWEVWCTGGTDATVSDAYSHSEPNSMMLIPASDIVQRYNETSGQLVFSFYIYVPSTATGGSASINLMNAYCDPLGWSASTTFNPDTNLVAAYSGGSTTLIEDEWVQYRAEIDLDNDTLNEFYGDTQFVFNAIWTTNISPGPLALVAADFYSDFLNESYIDNVVLESAGGEECYPDCDATDSLDLFDFLCFVNDFNAFGEYSDCDLDAEQTLFDFLCFVNAFNAGC